MGTIVQLIQTCFMLANASKLQLVLEQPGTGLVRIFDTQFASLNKMT